jgi:membrane-bound ClpP family serine protease
MSALGFVLIAAGVVLILAEAHLSSAGILGVLGVAALIAGVAFALSTTGLVVALVVAGIAGIAAATLLVLALPHVAAVRRRRVRTGAEALVGRVGVIRGSDGDGTRVFIDGALWAAKPSQLNGDRELLHDGDRVVIENVEGLTLSVHKTESSELSP